MVSKEMREGVEVEVDRREPLAAVAGQRRRLSTSAAMLPSFRSHLAPRSPRPARAVRSAVRALSRPRARRKRKRALHAALSLPKQRGENLLSHFERERKILKRGSSSFSAKLQEFRKMSAFFFCAPVSAAQLRFKRRRRRPVCHARTKMRAEEKRQRRSSSREGVLLERASFSFFGPSGRTIMKPPRPLSAFHNQKLSKTNLSTHTHRSRSPPSVSSTTSISYALLSTSLGGIVNVKSLPCRGPTSTKPSHRASVPFSPGRSCGCLQHPIVGEPGAVAVTAARATEDEDDDSMSRAIVARTGWATRRGGREGEEGGGRDEADASSADDDERRRRRLAAAAGEQRAIVPSVSGSGGLFRSLEGYFPRARVSSAALDEQKKKRDGSGFEENRTRGKEKEKAFDALSRKSKNGSGQVSENEKTSSTFSLSLSARRNDEEALPPSLSPFSAPRFSFETMQGQGSWYTPFGAVHPGAGGGGGSNGGGGGAWVRILEKEEKSSAMPRVLVWRRRAKGDRKRLLAALFIRPLQPALFPVCPRV